MAYKNILVDTNICIDAALIRKPFVTNALKIIELSESGKINAQIAAHSFDTIFYLLRKDYSVSQRYTLIGEFRSVFKVAPVNQVIIDKALKLKWPDFEDAIHYQAALAAGCEAVITRNPNDFESDGLPVLSPQQFLAETSENDG